MKGRCLCGAIGFSFDAEPNWVLHCHCESCRRATSSPYTTWVSVPDDALIWSGEGRQTYHSSPGATRTFCGTCGSPLSYAHERFPGETHVYAASLDDPEAVSPTRHAFHGERLSWSELHDALPRFDGITGGGRKPESMGPAC